VTFGLRYGLDLLRDCGIHSERIRLIGGGAKNPLWRQIIADVMDAPVICTTHGEAAALGAAIQAAWCHARQDDPQASLEEICERCVSLDEETAVRPDTRAVAAYEQVYRRYRELVNSLYGQR
ncbi:MAG TPA: xylulokinase, partial [Pseudomonas sp.]|nr:xylulokinase [Pseudomonas sp.]